MTRDDWYRNTEWNEAIEEAFNAKLKRARDKAQYLRIQACTLADTHPKVALRLLDRYLELGDTFHIAPARLDQANAYLALNDVRNAIDSYHAALAYEASHPNHKTTAFADFPFLVAIKQIRDEYDAALDVIATRAGDAAFPVQQFKLQASRALIQAEKGQIEDAKAHAKLALDAAEIKHTGFQNHQHLGLVGDEYRIEISRLEAILKV